MADCGNRYGSEIAGVRPEDIEVLISAEKLRGTDFCVGAIDATQRMYQPQGLESTFKAKIKHFLLVRRLSRPDKCSK